jgi:hypothetical protein
MPSHLPVKRQAVTFFGRETGRHIFRKKDKTAHSPEEGKDDKKIVYKFENFSETQKNQIGLKFHTKDENFVENVRVTYRYMDSVPSNLNASLKYKNEQNEQKTKR